MNRPRCYVLRDKTPVAAADLMIWARWLETAERHVGNTAIGPLRVSTVFLGLDHNFLEEGPPLLFETMIFGETPEPFNGSYQERCSTWEEAETQHADAVKIAKERVARAVSLLHPHNSSATDQNES